MSQKSQTRFVGLEQILAGSHEDVRDLGQALDTPDIVIVSQCLGAQLLRQRSQRGQEEINLPVQLRVRLILDRRARWAPQLVGVGSSDQAPDLAPGAPEPPLRDVLEHGVVAAARQAQAVEEVVLVEPGLPVVAGDLPEVGEVVLRDLLALIDVPARHHNDPGAAEELDDVRVAGVVQQGQGGVVGRADLVHVPGATSVAVGS